MSALWIPGCAGSESARVLAARPSSLTSGATPPVPAWPLRVLAQRPQKSWFDDDLSPGLPQSGLLHEGGGVLVGGCAYCTNPRTLRSTPDPLPVDPDPRAVREVSGLDSRAEALVNPTLAPGEVRERCVGRRLLPGRRLRGQYRTRPRPSVSTWETSTAGAPIRRGGTWWWCHLDGRPSQRIRPPRDV